MLGSYYIGQLVCQLIGYLVGRLGSMLVIKSLC